MTVPEHLDESAERSEDARLRIDVARRRAGTPEDLRRWLEALTDYVFALSEMHRYGNESIHEKLHYLAAQLRLTGFPSDERPTGHVHD